MLQPTIPLITDSPLIIWFDCLVWKMSSLWEKCLSQFPRQQSDVFIFLSLSSLSLHFPFHEWERKAANTWHLILETIWNNQSIIRTAGNSSFLINELNNRCSSNSDDQTFTGSQLLVCVVLPLFFVLNNCKLYVREFKLAFPRRNDRSTIKRAAD